MEPEKQHIYSYYREQFDKTEEKLFESENRLNRLIVMLSGGALTLSVTFLGSTPKEPIYFTIFILALAWGFLIGSLIAITLSTHASHCAIRWRQARFIKAMDDLGELPSAINPYARDIRVQHNIAIISCIFGLGLLSLFVLFNKHFSITANT